MNSYQRLLFLVTICGVAYFGGMVRNTLAWKQVQDEWQTMYLTDHPDKDFSTLCRKKAKCHLCHQGRKKQNNNPYGARFEGKLTKKDRRNKEKIAKVILEVGRMRSNPKDEKSPTFDELIASSKLPGGDLKSVKKEPKKDAGKKDSHTRPAPVSTVRPGKQP